MRVIADHLCALEAHLALIDEQIEAQRRSSATAQALETIPGIGALISAALVVFDPEEAAWRKKLIYAVNVVA